MHLEFVTAAVLLRTFPDSLKSTITIGSNKVEKFTAAGIDAPNVLDIFERCYLCVCVCVCLCVLVRAYVALSVCVCARVRARA